MSANAFQEIQARYAALVDLYRRGQLAPEAFAAQAAALKAQDHDGRWWTISAQTGRWVWWNGAQWIEGTPPVAAAPQPQRPAGALAGSVRESAVATARVARGSLFRYALFRAIPIGGTAVGAWLLHTYLLVFKNDGFNPDTAISNWINVTGNWTSAFAIWGVASALAWSFVYALFTVGPIRAVKGIFGAPFRLFGMLGRATPSDLGGFAAGAGIALFLGQRFGLNTQASLCLAGGLTIFGAGYPGMLASTFLTNLFSGYGRRRAAAGGRAVDFGRLMPLVVAGVGPGLLLGALLSTDLALPASLGLVVLGAVLVFSSKRGAQPPPAQIAAALVAAVGVALAVALVRHLFSATVHADDGGASECGKTDFAEYLQNHDDCAGADQAISNGYGPGAGAGGGALTPPADGNKPPSYWLVTSASAHNLKAGGEAGVWVYGRVMTDDPKANAAALTAGIGFSLAGDSLGIVQSSPPQMAGNAMAVYVTAGEPADAQTAELSITVGAEAATPAGPIYGGEAIQIRVEPKFQLELF